VISTEVKIPKIVAVVKCSGGTQKTVPASVTATQLTTPKSTDNGTCSALQRSLAQSAKRLSSPEIISSGAACFPGRLTQQFWSTKISEPKITAGVEAKVDESSSNGSTSVMDQNAADGSKDTVRLFRATVAESSDYHHEMSVPSLLDRARPALSTTNQSGDNTSKTTSTEALPTGKTTYVSPSSTCSFSPPSISSIDRSRDAIPVTEPVRLVFRHVSSRFSTDKEQIAAATTNRSDVSQKPSDRSAYTMAKCGSLSSPSSSVSGRISTSTASVSSSDRDSVSDNSLSSPSLSHDDSTFITPTSSVFSKSGVNSTRVNMVVKPKRSEPLKPHSIDSKTTISEQRRSSVEKQDVFSTKSRHLYKPKSMGNLFEPSYGRKTYQTSQILSDNDNEVSPLNQADTTSELVHGTSTGHSGDGVYHRRRRLKDSKLERPKSTYDLLSTTSHSRDYDDKKSHEGRQNATKFRSKPIVKGLLENLTVAKERNMQEHDHNINKGKEMASKMPDVVACANSRAVITRRSEQLPQQAVAKHKRILPVTSDPVASQVSSDITLEQDKGVALTLLHDQLRATSPKADKEPTELIGKKKYLTKWQAELQRRQEPRPSQLNNRYSEQRPLPRQPVLSDSSDEKTVTPVENSPSFLAAKNHALSSKFSKSVNDLSQITRLEAAATGKVEGKREEQMTDWQIEVERRRAARGGRYIDPEKLPRFQRHNTTSRMIAETPENIHKSMLELNGDSTVGCTGHHNKDFSDQSVGALYKSKKKSKSVDNLATCHLTPDTSGLTSPKLSGGRKQLNAGASLDTETSNWSSEVHPSSPRSVVVTRIPVPSSPPPDHLYESIDDFQKSPVAEQDNTCEVGDLLVIAVHCFAANMLPKLSSRLLTHLLYSRVTVVQHTRPQCVHFVGLFV